MVRMVNCVRHIATVNQGRLSLLAGVDEESGVEEEAQLNTSMLKQAKANVLPLLWPD